MVYVMDTKITRILAIEITVVSVVFLGVGINTGLSSCYGPNFHKHAVGRHAVDTVQEFAREGVVREASGFDGGISECSQIQWPGSIYD